MDAVVDIARMGVVYGFYGLIIFAAVHDIIDLTIPNWVVGAIFGLFLLAAAVSQIGWVAFGLHLAVGAATLLVVFILFAFNVVGGGDSKLIAVVALWFGWSTSATAFAFATCIVGGVLSLLLIVLHRVPLPLWAYRLKGIPQFGHPSPPVPYGVAISVGALYGFPSSALYAAAFAA